MERVGHHMVIEELLFANITELNSHTSTFVGYARFSGFRDKNNVYTFKTMIFKEICPLFYFIYICLNKPGTSIDLVRPEDLEGAAV